MVDEFETACPSSIPMDEEFKSLYAAPNSCSNLDMFDGFSKGILEGHNAVRDIRGCWYTIDH